jgi:hypothetical protein
MGYKFSSLAPSFNAVAVSKSDATVIPATRALYIGVAGDVVVTMEGGTGPITFKAVPVGVLNISVTQVLAATAATDIVALY